MQDTTGSFRQARKHCFQILTPPKSILVSPSLNTFTSLENMLLFVAAQQSTSVQSIVSVEYVVGVIAETLNTVPAV
jgi:hypothetical protein